MNKLSAALLFLMIGGSLATRWQKEMEVRMNRYREIDADKLGITIRPITYSLKLEEMAEKYCEKCSPKDQINEPGYKAYQVTTDEEKDKLLELLQHPDTKEFGVCTGKECNFREVYIVKSGDLITSSLTFLVAFVMIFRGI